MAEILKRSKPLAVSPLKASQPTGAALAFLGLKNAIPMLHGSQGCTAFGKVFFVRHFREPIPLQTTAMDQVSTIMMVDAETTPLTLGGTPKSEIASMGESAATLVIGRSLAKAADLLKERTGVPDHRFDHLLGLDACDAFTLVLAEISGQPVPAKIDRQRAQLQDAMVDTHFMTGFLRVGIAADPDLLLALGAFLAGVGAEIVTAVSPARAEVLAEVPANAVRIGDLEDLERGALEHRAQLLISNSHAAQAAERLQIPLLRAGFPQYDWVGGYARTWVGYRGARAALFDIANLFLGNHHDTPAYRSIYRTDAGLDPQVRAAAGAGLVRH